VVRQPGVGARRARAAALALLLISPLAASPAVAASTTSLSSPATGSSGPAADSVSLSTNAIATTGINVVSVTVSAHLTSPTPLTTGPACGNAHEPLVVFTRVSGAGGAAGPVSFPLTLVTGSVTDGTWTATPEVTAGWDGVWRLSAIYLETPPGPDTGGGSPCGDVVWQPPAGSNAYDLVVTGSNRPQFTYTWTPNPAPASATSLTVSGRLALQDGTPIADQHVHVTPSCFATGPTDTVVTDAMGRFTATRPRNIMALEVCMNAFTDIEASGGQVVYADAILVAPLKAQLTASALSSRVNLGRTIDVTGRVRGALLGYPGILQLQRYAAGRWHDVHAWFRTDGTNFRLRTRPPVRGNLRYRVYLPAHSDRSSGANLTAISTALTIGVR
jgi:hypothetical protein